MKSEFKFLPLKFSWVAIHPNPVGVVHFIGGAFFGSFPTLFYRFLLQEIYDQGYTIIALPYRFTFRHWSVAIGLVREQQALRQAIVSEAKRRNYAYEIYEEDPTSETQNNFWIGHSLGNKYIALLELLTDLETKTEREILGDCVGSDQYQEIADQLKTVRLKDLSLYNQPSVLIAPAITGIRSAIPVEAVARFFQSRGLDVKPDVRETHCLIKGSKLFGLTGLISFTKDDIAKDTVNWLKGNLTQKPVETAELQGEHLTPLGYRRGDFTLVNTVLKYLKAA